MKIHLWIVGYLAVILACWHGFVLDQFDVFKYFIDVLKLTILLYFIGWLIR